MYIAGLVKITANFSTFTCITFKFYAYNGGKDLMLKIKILILKVSQALPLLVIKAYIVKFGCPKFRTKNTCCLISNKNLKLFLSKMNMGSNYIKLAYLSREALHKDGH